VVVQDCQTNEVLMLAYANEKALAETAKTGYATFWKTSENRLWTKGEASGDFLGVKEILTDCDQDALVYKVGRLGDAVCHTKRRSCFYRRLAGGRPEFLEM
jgi:phosphoribosyl-AMP cyclohydrolase